MSKARKFRYIATKVRKELESFRENKCMGFYSAPDLGGLCFYGAAMLYEAFHEKGFDAKIVAGCGHWYIICDGYLVDVTASQFGMADVVVRKYDNIRRLNIFKKPEPKYKRLLTFWDNRSIHDKSNWYHGIDDWLNNINKAREYCKSV